MNFQHMQRLDPKGFLEFIPDMACLVDHNGVIVDCNDALSEKLGYKKSEIVGKLGFDLIADEDKKMALEQFEKLAIEKKVENIELWGLTKTGRYRALSTTSIIPLEDGKALFLVLTKDITESYNQQKKFQELKENFSNLGEVTSKIAHDIKNPLTVLSNHIDILKRINKNDEELQKRLSTMHELVSDINNIVSDISNYTRIYSDSKSSILSSELVNTTLKGIMIPDNIELKQNGNIKLYCDATKMSIVLRNLISNSIDAIKDKGKIQINFSESESETVIKVIDSGSGVTNDKKEQIFDLLFTTKPHGSGLGLSICKNIVENHSGTITYSDKPTTFTIKLPKFQ